MTGTFDEDGIELICFDDGLLNFIDFIGTEKLLVGLKIIFFFCHN